MQKIGISILITVVLALLVVGAILLFEKSAKWKPQPARDDGLAAVRDDLAEVVSELKALKERIALLEASGERMGPPPPPSPTRRETAAAPTGDSLDTRSEAFRQLVFSLIEEERELAAERQRTRIEEQRREREELSKGPYGRFNLKVNSLAQILGLDQGQKDRYYELTKAHWDELQENRRQTDFRSTEGRTHYRATQERILTEYAHGVEQLLTPDQLEAYGKLPTWSRNLQSLGQVMASGEATARYGPMRTYMQGTRPSTIYRGERPGGQE